VTGSVVDESGRLVSDFSVGATPRKLAFLGPIVEGRTQPGGGRFEIDLDAGEWSIAARAGANRRSEPV